MRQRTHDVGDKHARIGLSGGQQGRRDTLGPQQA